MRPTRPRLARTFLLSAFGLALVAGGSYDRPDLRRQWEARRGTPTRAYLEHLAKVAEREARREAQSRQRMKALTAAPAAEAALGQWINLGPFTARWGWNVEGQNRVSGRIRGIVTHPTDPRILYVATAGGGVFKCVNADPESQGDWIWTPITEGLPALGADGTIAVGALAMSPSDPDTLYLAMGDPHGSKAKGFYISRDAGTTWTKGGDLDTLDAWQILAPDASTVLVATQSGLFRSADGGRTFDRVLTENTSSIQGFGPRDLVAAGNGRIFHSADGGATWQAATLPASPSFARLTLATASATSVGWAMGGNRDQDGFPAGLLKTEDKGRTWSWVANGNLSLGNQAWYNQMLAVDPQDPSRIFAGGQTSFLRSLDGGLNWMWVSAQGAVTHADFHAAAWSKTGARVLYVGHDGGLTLLRDPFRATPPSQNDPTWLDHSRNKGLASHLVYHVGSTLAPFPADARHRISLGLQDNGTMVREPENGTREGSTAFRDRLGSDGLATLVHPMDGDLVLGTTQTGYVSRSADFGETWAGASAGLEGEGFFHTPLWQDWSDPSGNTVYTARMGGLFRSTDFAQTWSRVPFTGVDTGFTPFGFAVGRTNGQALAMTQGAEIHLSYNGGSSWIKAALPAGVPNIASLWFDTANDQVIYAACDAYAMGYNHLWRSQDGGRTWRSLDGSATASNGYPFGVPAHALQNDPRDSRRLFVATDMGMYQSQDGGATWSRLGAGLPLVAVRQFYLAPDGTFLRAASYGRGVWEIRLREATPVGTSITSPASDLTVDSGQVLDFRATAANGQAGASFSYFWDFGDGSRATGAAASHAFVNPSASERTFQVKLVAQDAFGSTGGAARTITVRTAPDTWAPLVSDPFVDGKRGIVTLSGRVTDNRAVTRVEFLVDGVLMGQGAPNASDPAFFAMSLDTALLSDGNHTLTVKAYDAAGNEGRATLPFFVNNAFDLALVKPFTGGIGVPYTKYFEGTPIAFEGRATALKEGRTFSARWEFGDGGTATGFTPSHTYAEGEAYYPVVFTVTDNTGLADSVKTSLYVRKKPVFMEAEANDSLGAANAVDPTFGSIQGNLPTTSDQDHFTLTLQPGQSLDVAMSGPAGVDWDLYLKSTSGSTLAKSEGSTAAEQIRWTHTGTAARTVVLQVVPYSGTHKDPYTLKLGYSAVTADTQAPTVSPVAASGNSGTVKLSATATDDLGVAKVEFYADGQLLGTDSAAPFEWSWDTTRVPNGDRVLTAKAFDAAGNAATSQPATLTVDNVVSTTLAETEPNNGLSSANGVGSEAGSLTGFVGSGTDTDHFRLGLAPGQTLQVDMTGPSTKDYDLYLLSASGSTLRSSTGNGSTESLSYTNGGSTARTVYLKVKGYGGAYSTTVPYKLTLTRQ